MLGVLLVWSGDAPVFEPIAPIENTWALGREHPAWPVPDGRMSRNHCELTVVDGAWRIHDRGSANGVRLDGRTISGEARRSGWRLLQLGRSLLIPCRLPQPRPEIAGDPAARLARGALEQLGKARDRVIPPGELSWWIHHAVRAASSITIDVSFVAMCLRCNWRGVPDLLECIDRAIAAAGSSPSLRDEHLGDLQIFGDYREVAHPGRRIVGGIKPAGVPPEKAEPSEFNRLRDPVVFVEALKHCEGNHRRAAAYLELTLEGFERWLARHGLTGE
jgi:hypothetical protein